MVEFFTSVFIKLKTSTHWIGTLLEVLERNLLGNSFRLLAEFTSLGTESYAGFISFCWDQGGAITLSSEWACIGPVM